MAKFAKGSSQWWSFWKQQLENEQLKGKARIYVSNLSQVNEKTENFFCKFFLTIEIESSRLFVDDGADVEDWDPLILFSNASGDGTIVPSVNKNSSKGVIAYYYNVEHTFEADLNLRMFPFDFQELELSISSDWDARFLVFEAESGEDMNIVDELASKKTAALFRLDHQVQWKPSVNQSSNYSYSMLNAVMLLERKPWAYIFTDWLRQFLVTSLAFSSFAIELGLGQSRDRLNVVVGLLLTSSLGFKRESGVVTWIDLYTIIAFVVIGIILSYHGFGVALVPQNDVDRTVGGLLGVLWILVNVSFIIAAILQKQKAYSRRRKWGRGTVFDTIASTLNTVTTVVVDTVDNVADTLDNVADTLMNEKKK